MRTTGAWAHRRQIQYGALFAFIFLLIGTYIYFAYFYSAPTCFNGKEDGEETGVDCGGACVRICAFEIKEPTVKWSRSFKVTRGQYNAVAYVENPNRVAATEALNYTFSLYDESGLIVERSGTTILPPNSVYPIFEGRIQTGNRAPTRTFIEIEPPEVWQPAEAGREQFAVIDRELTGADAKPKLDAVVRNESLEEAKEVEVVATIFDAQGTALAASRTFVENFAPRSDTGVVFTWLEPIATTIRSCEIPTDVLVAIDVSGSMNDDNDNPPQPITAVKQAAERFVNRLNGEDQVGVVSFATEASLLAPLSDNTDAAASVISRLNIDPEEETGSTNTGDGIEVSGQELLSLRHNLDARKTLVLLTDGLATAPAEEPETYALEKATSVKLSGVELYSIGLGENVNMDFVRAISSGPNYAYQALTSSDVDRIYQTITSSLCEEGAAVIDIIPKTDAGFVPLR